LGVYHESWALGSWTKRCFSAGRWARGTISVAVDFRSASSLAVAAVLLQKGCEPPQEAARCSTSNTSARARHGEPLLLPPPRTSPTQRPRGAPTTVASPKVCLTSYARHSRPLARRVFDGMPPGDALGTGSRGHAVAARGVLLCAMDFTSLRFY